MKKTRILLLCMTFVLCTFCFAGCGNSENTESKTTTRNEQTTGNKGTTAGNGDKGTSAGNGNKGTTAGNGDKGTSAGKNSGIMNGIKDEVETLIDDAETVIDKIMN